MSEKPGVSASQVKTYFGGNYEFIDDFLNRKVVKQIPFVAAQELTVSSDNYALIDDSLITARMAIDDGAGDLSGSESVQGGVVSGKLPGPVGTASASIVIWAEGSVLNIVSIRDASTHNPIIDSGTGRKVMGLLQADSSAVDNDLITASGSENLQISFVVFNASGGLDLVDVTGTIQFHTTKLYSQRYLPALMKEGGIVSMDITDATISASLTAIYTITTALQAGEILDLVAGTGSLGGAASISGDPIALPETGAAFISDSRIEVSRNGVEQIRGDNGDGTPVEWITTTTMRVKDEIDIGEEIIVEVPSVF